MFPTALHSIPNLLSGVRWYAVFFVTQARGVDGVPLGFRTHVASHSLHPFQTPSTVLWVGSPIVGKCLTSIPSIQSIVLSDQSWTHILLASSVRTRVSMQRQQVRPGLDLAQPKSQVFYLCDLFSLRKLTASSRVRVPFGRRCAWG